jgi:hypothetical protein
VASPPLEWVFAAIKEAGATSIAHCCAPDIPISLLTGAGAGGVSVDLPALPISAYDDLGTLVEAGQPVLLGVVPSTDPSTAPTEKALVERVLRLLDMLGFDAETAGESLMITPTCGLAGASPAWARRALELSQAVAADLSTG